MDITKIISDLMSNIPGWVYLLMLFCIGLVIVIGLVLNYKLHHVLLVAGLVGIIGFAVLSIVYVPLNQPTEAIAQSEQTKNTIVMPDGTVYELPATPTPVPQTVQEIGEDALKKIEQLYDDYNDTDIVEIMDEGFTPEELQKKMSELTGLDVSIEEAKSLYEILQMSGLFNQPE